MLTVFRFSKKAPLPIIISFVYDAHGEQAPLLQVRLLDVSKSGTAMILPGLPGSSLTRFGTGAMPSTRSVDSISGQPISGHRPSEQ